MTASAGLTSSESQHLALCNRFLPTLEGLPEPDIGHLQHSTGTLCFNHDREVRFDLVFKYRSASLIQTNLDTTNGARDVLEIGAGYGALAALLAGNIPIKSYTIVDLPQNLRQAQQFLSGQLSRVNLDFRFLTPMQFAFDKSAYDLVINEASLSEMRKATAAAYIDEIHSRLREGGVFFWQNGRARGLNSDVTTRFSEYRLSRFKILTTHPQRGRKNLEHEGALILILQKTHRDETDLIVECGLEVLAQLADAGLTEDLGDLSGDMSIRSLLSHLAEWNPDSSVPGNSKITEQAEVLPSKLVLHEKELASVRESFSLLHQLRCNGGLTPDQVHQFDGCTQAAFPRALANQFLREAFPARSRVDQHLFATDYPLAEAKSILNRILTFPKDKR